MKSYIILLLLIAVVVSGRVLNGLKPRLPSMASLKESDGRITNGQLALPGQFPYQVGLLLEFEDGFYWCGGSLISDLWVLTVAHCTYGAYSVTVYLGAIDILNDNEVGQQRVYTTNETITVHPDWNPSDLTNDIALIELPETIVFNDRIQPATLPKKDGKHLSYVGYKAWASGWGKENDASTTVSQFLRYIERPVIKQTVCNIGYFGAVTEDMICTSGKDGKSTCSGDSGGPLVYKDGTTNYLIGCTSFGIVFGCELGWPSVYTRVTSYLDWIEATSGVVNN